VGKEKEVKDFEGIEMTREEAEEAAKYRKIWRSCVARCVARTGRIKV